MSQPDTREPSPPVVDPEPTDDGATQGRADRRLRGLRIVVLIVLVLIYLGSVLLYARSNADRGVEDIPEAVDNGVMLAVVPTGLEAQSNTMNALLYVYPGVELLDDDGKLRDELTVDIFPVFGESTFVQPAGTLPKPLSIKISMTGNVQDYPFDRYEANLIAVASTADPDLGRTLLPTTLGVAGDLVGWVLNTGTATDLTPEEIDAINQQGVGSTTLTVRRAGSTMAISLLMLTLMVVLAVLGLLVARAVATRRRKIEATMASWFGAMLFALVPLRGFLPGAPPLGSWIDILIVFWVEVALMVALAMFITSWLRMGPKPDN